MPNPVFNEAIDAVTGFLGLSGDRRDVIYDDYLDPASPRMNKALEERGFIEFRYGGSQFSVDESDLFSFREQTQSKIRKLSNPKKLPFFEDPVIKETSQAEYATNKILMANEPARLYTGTDVRSFSLELTYSLPHVIAMLRTFDTKEEAANIEAVRQKMVEIIRSDFSITPEQINNTIRTADNTPVGSIVKGKAEGPRMPVQRDFNLGESLLDNYMYQVASNPESYGQSELYGYIGYLMNLVISSIRSSTAEAQSGTAKYGPPIALLKYGAVYDYVPCIVKRYRVEYRSDSGNDNGSLYPRVIRVKLELEEFRQNNGFLHGEGNDTPWGWDTLFREGKEPRSTL